MFDWNAGSAPALQSADRRVGAGVAASHAAPLAGAGGEDRRSRGSRTYDPDCYLCPGNARAGGVRNPALHLDLRLRQRFRGATPGHARRTASTSDGLLVAEAEPRHLPRGLLLAAPRPDRRQGWSAATCARVVDTWAEQYRELGARPDINYVQIFENRGAMMGAQQSASALPDLVQPHAAQRAGQGAGSAAGVARTRRGTCLLCDYARWNGETASASSARTILSWRWCRSGRSGRSRRW